MEYRSDDKEPKAYRLNSAESNQIYYHEYKKLYEHSLLLKKQFAQTSKRQQALYRYLTGLNSRAQEFHDFEGLCKKDRKRKTRRCNLKMEKNYECPSNRCSNKYGSQSSLNKHVKLKHAELQQEMKSRAEEMSFSISIQNP